MFSCANPKAKSEKGTSGAYIQERDDIQQQSLRSRHPVNQLNYPSFQVAQPSYRCSGGNIPPYSSV